MRENSAPLAVPGLEFRVLAEKARHLMQEGKHAFKQTGEKQRLFDQFFYAAKNWKHERKVITKAEYTSDGENPRFIVTNLEGDPQDLYDEIYYGRGDMENHIKQLQLELLSDRTSPTFYDGKKQ